MTASFALILIGTLAFQLAAVGLVLRGIRTTGVRTPWTLFASAMALATLQTFLGLIGQTASAAPSAGEFLTALTTMAVSVFMVAFVVLSSGWSLNGLSTDGVSSDALSKDRLSKDDGKRPDGATPAAEPDAGPQFNLECNILLVEDGAANARFFSTIFTKSGARVTVEENGQLAVNRLLTTSPGSKPSYCDLEDPFDIILMDMQMPVMDGYEATVRLREAGYDGTIIALTGHTKAYDRQKCLAVGCDDYITKGVSREELLKTIAKHLSEMSADAPG